MITILFFAWIQSVLACSSFYFKHEGKSYLAKNYDWHFGEGFITANYKNLQKQSFDFKQTKKKLRWTSEYSSLTFNQFGKGSPLGGINEKGLTIEVLWLDDSSYPAPGQKPTLHEVEWIQYALDTADTIETVVAVSQRMEIDPIYAKVHYLVCDLNRCAVFEYLDKKKVFHLKKDLPYPALTNSTYTKSLEAVIQYEPFGGNKPIPKTATETLERFSILAHALRFLPVEQPLSYAQALLKRVAQGGEAMSTQWQIIYELNDRTIHVKSSPQDTYHRLSFGDLVSKKSCVQKPGEWLLPLPLADKLETRELTAEINQSVVESALEKINFKLSKEQIEAFSRHTFLFKCAGEK